MGVMSFPLNLAIDPEPYGSPAIEAIQSAKPEWLHVLVSRDDATRAVVMAHWDDLETTVAAADEVARINDAVEAAGPPEVFLDPEDSR